MNMIMLPPLANILSPLDLLVIFLIAVLVFGPRTLSGLGKGLGDGIRNFKSAVSDDKKPNSNATTEKK